MLYNRIYGEKEDYSLWVDARGVRCFVCGACCFGCIPRQGTFRFRGTDLGHHGFSFAFCGFGHLNGPYDFWKADFVVPGRAEARGVFARVLHPYFSHFDYRSGFFPARDYEINLFASRIIFCTLQGRRNVLSYNFYMGVDRMPSFPAFESASSEKRLESFALSSEEFGERRLEEGFPVQVLTGRVDMTHPGFRELRGKLQWNKDIETIQKREEQYKTRLLDLSGSHVEERLKHEGEQFELLTALMLEKFLSHRFVVLRSSPHDDIHNGVDTILMDRETGEIVCAFDEVGDDAKMLQDKEERSVRTNLSKGGVRLDYGFRKNKEGKFVPASVEHLPLFHLAISSRDLREMVPSLLDEAPSRQEHLFFRDFLKLMLQQAGSLNEVIFERIRAGGASLRGERSLALWEIKKRVEIFEKALQEAWDKEFGVSYPGAISL